MPHYGFKPSTFTSVEYFPCGKMVRITTHPSGIVETTTFQDHGKKGINVRTFYERPYSPQPSFKKPIPYSPPPPSKTLPSGEKIPISLFKMIGEPSVDNVETFNNYLVEYIYSKSHMDPAPIPLTDYSVGILSSSQVIPGDVFSFVQKLQRNEKPFPKDCAQLSKLLVDYVKDFSAKNS